MKKIILSLSVLAILVACSPDEKNDKKETENDSIQVDTKYPNENNKPKVKDYAYYRNLFKKAELDGVQLEQFNFYEDSANKNVNLIYRVNNSAEVGYDEIIMGTSVCKTMMGEDKKKCDNFNMETFLYFQNFGMEKKDRITASEYKSGDVTFYYGTRKNIKGTMGGANFHQMIIEGKAGEFVLNARVNVWNLKSDMVKAEIGLKLIADYIAQ